MNKPHRVILKCVCPFPQVKQCNYLVYDDEFYGGGFYILIEENRLLYYKGHNYYYDRPLLKIIDSYHAMLPKWLTLYQCYKQLGYQDLFSNIMPHYFNKQLWEGTGVYLEPFSYEDD